MIWRRDRIACEPYQGLAQIYDFVMLHIDYKGWASYVEAIFSRFGTQACLSRARDGRQVHQILELACGTGTLALELARRGYSVSGTDASEAMIKIAEDKAESAGIPIPFWQMDMRNIKTSCCFDAVLCLYDSINYIKSKKEMEKILGNVYSILGQRGIFIFDICTEANSLRHFRDRVEKDKGEGFSYRRYSHYNPKTKIQTTEFHIRFDDRASILTEIHRQRIYTLHELIELIGRSSFRDVSIYDGLTFQEGTEDSDRIHFVLQKGGSDSNDPILSCL